LGIPFSVLERAAALARIHAMIHDGGAHHIVLANAHTVNCACADRDYHAVLCRAALVLRDGVGVELAGILRRRPMPDNFVGTDFIPYLLERLGPPVVRVALFGGAPGIAAAAAAALGARCSGVCIAGVEHGYAGHESVIEAVRAARPDVLLVGLGNPLQER